MNNRGIITQLRAVGAEANDCFETLNDGGCAVYAATVRATASAARMRHRAAHPGADHRSLGAVA